eukprot:6214835-Pleurochrysis_carterae.AAC.1
MSAASCARSSSALRRSRRSSSKSSRAERYADIERFRCDTADAACSAPFCQPSARDETTSARSRRRVELQRSLAKRSRSLLV